MLPLILVGLGSYFIGSAKDGAAFAEGGAVEGQDIYYVDIPNPKDLENFVNIGKFKTKQEALDFIKNNLDQSSKDGLLRILTEGREFVKDVKSGKFNVDEIYAKGGKVKKSKSAFDTTIANKLIALNDKAWEHIEDGNQLYENEEVQKKYIKDISGADAIMAKAKNTDAVMDILEDENCHSLYNYFVLRGIKGKELLDRYKKMYNDGGSYMFLNPKLVK